jgi:hypothetical protein
MIGFPIVEQGYREVFFLFVNLVVVIAAKVYQVIVMITLLICHRRIVPFRSRFFAGDMRSRAGNSRIILLPVNGQGSGTSGECAEIAIPKRQ